MAITKNHLTVLGQRHEEVVGELLIVEGIFSAQNDWEGNSAKAEAKDMDACGCCGRAVKPGSGFRAWALYGDALAPVANWTEMSNYQGDWVNGDLGVLVIGPDCAKQIPDAYRERNAI